MIFNIKNEDRKLENKRLSNDTEIYPALRNTKEGKVYGYINGKGIFVIDPIYLNAYDFNNNESAIVQEGEKFGLINKKGE